MKIKIILAWMAQQDFSHWLAFKNKNDIPCT